MSHTRRDSTTRVRLSAVLVLAVVALLTLTTGGSSAQDGGEIPPISPPVDSVYVARAFDFADSLSGSVLAALSNSPMLLVPGGNNDTVPDSVADKLRDLEPDEIVILGGTVAVSAAVEATLETIQGEWRDPANIRRISGVTRLETAQAIADELPSMVPEAAFAHQAGDADTVGGLEPDTIVTNENYLTYVHRLDGDQSEVVIAENGPLTAFARCTSDPGGDEIEVFFTATVDGWWEEDSGPHSSGDEIDVMSNTGDADSAEYEDDIDETSAVAEEDGVIYYIGMDGETTGLGLNIFGHDCLVAGSVFLQQD